MENPGVDNRKFNLIFDNTLDQENFIFGIDWTIIDKPIVVEDGYKYTIKCLSNRMLNFVKNVTNR